MTIRRETRKGVSYVVEDSGGFLGRFETLADAALVVRYISGGNLTEDEARRAREIMAK